MRGKAARQGEIYHSFYLEDMVPAHHPLRAVICRADKVLGKMSRRFNQAYGKTGRPSVPPERLTKALLRHSAHILMENRNGLCLSIAVDQADGYAERVQCDAMLDHVQRRHGLWPKTLGADAGYKDGTYLDAFERWGLEPHVPVGDDKIVGEDPGAWARRRARRRPAPAWPCRHSTRAYERYIAR